MFERLSLRNTLSVLIIGEIMTISAEIMSHISIEEVMKLVTGFAVMWIVCIFVYRAIGCIQKVNRQ